MIGQPGFTTNTVNQGGLSERSLSFGGNRGDLAFDSRDNLWVAESATTACFAFPGRLWTPVRTGLPLTWFLASLDFVSNTLPSDQASNSPLNKSILRAPNSVALDSAGRLYVGDGFGRVLVFTPDFFNNKAASRLVGVEILQQGQTARVNEVAIVNVSAVFIANDRLGVSDPSTNRITIYDPFTTWPAETDAAPSPSAKIVIGQQGFSGFDPNRGQPEPAANSLAQPSGAFYAGSELFVADTANNRVWCSLL